MALARFIVTWLLYAHAGSPRDVAADSAKLEGSRLVVHAAGQIVEGNRLAGAEIGAAGGNRYRIESYQPPEPGKDIHRYVVSQWDGAAWVPFCKDAAPAVPLYGYWDNSGAKHASPDFTFACLNAALGKCVNFGYRPWVSKELDLLHQSCTRLLRADYCGDGRSFTQDGTQISINDTVGINPDDGANWNLEAEWTPSGARCVVRSRRPEIPLPACAKRRTSKTCGATNPDGTLKSGAKLWNAVPPPGTVPKR